MTLTIDDRIRHLTAGPVHWFTGHGTPAEVIRSAVADGCLGVYCLWWRDPTLLPSAPRVVLSAGKRGGVAVELRLHAHGLSDAAALYVGKGLVRNRLVDHVKPKSGRNPHWWLRQLIGDTEPDAAIRSHLGFSFIQEPSGIERTYAENPA